MKKSIRKLRQQAFNRQAGLCFYCQFPIWRKSPDEVVKSIGLSFRAAKRLQCTAEHLQPLSLHGENTAANVVAACRFCNQTRHKAKRVRSPQEYLSYVQRRVHSKRWHPWLSASAT